MARAPNWCLNIVPLWLGSVYISRCRVPQGRSWQKLLSIRYNTANGSDLVRDSRKFKFLDKWPNFSNERRSYSALIHNNKIKNVKSTAYRASRSYDVRDSIEDLQLHLSIDGARSPRFLSKEYRWSLIISESIISDYLLFANLFTQISHKYAAVASSGH